MDRKESSSDIEQQWIVRVQEAQAQYRRAAENHDRMVEELNNTLIGLVEGPYAAANVHKAMVQALDELLRCQQVLADSVLRHHTPRPDEDEKRLI